MARRLWPGPLELNSAGSAGGVRMAVGVGVKVGGTGVRLAVGVGVGIERVAWSSACWKMTVRVMFGVGLPGTAADWPAAAQALNQIPASPSAAATAACESSPGCFECHLRKAWPECRQNITSHRDAGPPTEKNGQDFHKKHPL